jgi:hypothetical protein
MAQAGLDANGTETERREQHPERSISDNSRGWNRELAERSRGAAARDPLFTADDFRPTAARAGGATADNGQDP